MKSHEVIMQASVKVEKEGEELPVSSFEDVGADITNEHLAEYALEGTPKMAHLF